MAEELKLPDIHDKDLFEEMVDLRLLRNTQHNITNKSLDATGVCQYIRWEVIVDRQQ